MEYSVECECGKRLAVPSTAAGSTVQCTCRRSVAVPPLSQLRQSVGHGAFEAGIIDTIRRLIAEGQLPPGKNCLTSGIFTDDTADVIVHCERIWKRRPRKTTWALALLAIPLLPIWALWMLWDHYARDGENQDAGRDTRICIPLRICGECSGRLSASSQWRLRRLLRTVPVYASLLKEYPGARIIIPSPTEQKRERDRQPEEKRWADACGG